MTHAFPCNFVLYLQCFLPSLLFLSSNKYCANNLKWEQRQLTFFLHQKTSSLHCYLNSNMYQSALLCVLPFFKLHLLCCLWQKYTLLLLLLHNVPCVKRFLFNKSADVFILCRHIMTPDSDVIIRLHSIMTSESGVIICLHSIKTPEFRLHYT